MSRVVKTAGFRVFHSAGLRAGSSRCPMHPRRRLRARSRQNVLATHKRLNLTHHFDTRHLLNGTLETVVKELGSGALQFPLIALNPAFTPPAKFKAQRSAHPRQPGPADQTVGQETCRARLFARSQPPVGKPGRPGQSQSAGICGWRGGSVAEISLESQSSITINQPMSWDGHP
jgi:hypothetical protein